ncbi:MAG: hypothetical protein AB7G37_11495 [Solirubrobacteraceae bacterium]
MTVDHRPGDPGAVAHDLREALTGILALDDPAIARLRHARTTVAFRVDGSDDRMTLLLDRDPPEVVDGDAAEIAIDLSPGAARSMSVGALPLPGAIVAGDVRHTGPVRAYMAIDPIIRRALADRAGRDPADVVPASAYPPGIAPELLAIDPHGSSLGRSDLPRRGARTVGGGPGAGRRGSGRGTGSGRPGADQRAEATPPSGDMQISACDMRFLHTAGDDTVLGPVSVSLVPRRLRRLRVGGGGRPAGRRVAADTLGR